MNHADIKGLNLMEGWEILNTYLKLDYSYKLILNTYLYIIRCVYNKACDGNNVSGIQGAQTVW